jgi:hypothetical protein
VFGDPARPPVLDTPMVPLLNALVDGGLRPRASCADSYLLVDGLGAHQLAVAQTLTRRLPVASIAVFAGPLSAGGQTAVYWSSDGLSTEQLDLRLARAAEDVAHLPPPAGDPTSAFGRWLRGALARIDDSQGVDLGDGRRRTTQDAALTVRPGRMVLSVWVDVDGDLHEYEVCAAPSLRALDAALTSALRGPRLDRGLA